MNSRLNMATTVENYKNLISTSPDCKYFNDSPKSTSVLPKIHLGNVHLGNAHLLLSTAKYAEHRILFLSQFINPGRIILLHLIHEMMLQESHKYGQITEIKEKPDGLCGTKRKGKAPHSLPLQKSSSPLEGNERNQDFSSPGKPPNFTLKVFFSRIIYHGIMGKYIS